MQKTCRCRSACTCKLICRRTCKPRCKRLCPKPHPRPCPQKPKPKPRVPKKLRTTITTFYAVADGQQMSFADHNAAEGYGSSPIPDPKLVSYTNLFVNGMLQPASLYTQTSGQIRLLTSDAPEKGTPVIAQFIRILA